MNDTLALQLCDAKGAPLWYEHPTRREAVDVIVLPLETEAVTKRFYVKAFTPDNHVPGDVRILLGHDVLVLGYPLGFHDRRHNLPIVRSATLASVYPVPFEGEQFLLIDSRLHHGTSGSPVITKEADILTHANGGTMFTGQLVSFLVGIHSASLDLKDRDPKKDDPLGLNAVWFASLIPDIIDGGLPGRRSVAAGT